MPIQPLKGKRIAVIVESKYIPEEFAAYENAFKTLGAEVDLISRLWYGDYNPDNEHWTQPQFVSDVDPNDQKPWQTPELKVVNSANDVTNIKLDDYSAVIMAANYVSIRLRYTDMPNAKDAREFVQSAPVVQFYAEAMRRKDIVKGALCHGLWILTPHPELLKGRRVTCHTVVMADILNAGADIVFDEKECGATEPAKVVTDNDLITGFSKHEVLPFINAIADQILEFEKA